MATWQWDTVSAKWQLAMFKTDGTTQTQQLSSKMNTMRSGSDMHFIDMELSPLLDAEHSASACTSERVWRSRNVQK